MGAWPPKLKPSFVLIEKSFLAICNIWKILEPYFFIFFKKILTFENF